MTPADLRRLTADACMIARLTDDPVEVRGGIERPGEYLAAVLDLIPPTTSEIIAALERGDRIERWVGSVGKWVVPNIDTVEQWRRHLRDYGDQPQPGYRIVRGER